jgi:Nickel responsive protein SCO4226-like
MRKPVKEVAIVPRYLIHRTFPGGLALPANQAGAAVCYRVAETNRRLGVTWLHSYVSKDKETSFCIYDGPSHDAIRLAAERNGLPIDHITEVSVLDPHFFL